MAPRVQTRPYARNFIPARESLAIPVRRLGPRVTLLPDRKRLVAAGGRPPSFRAIGKTEGLFREQFQTKRERQQHSGTGLGQFRVQFEDPLESQWAFSSGEPFSRANSIGGQLCGVLRSLVKFDAMQSSDCLSGQHLWHDNIPVLLAAQGTKE